MSREWRFVVAIWVLNLVLAGALVVTELVTRAQEVERGPVTKQWHLAMLPGEGGYRPVRVDVIDTAGACLYVLRAWNAGDGNSPAIAVMPKTALGPRLGCQ